MVLGSNNGWSGLIAGPNLQPAPGNNPFLNLGAQPQMSQPFGQVNKFFSCYKNIIFNLKKIVYV